MNTIPKTVKRSIEFIGLFTFLYAIHMVIDIVLPLLFALLLSFLLLTPIRKLQKIGLPSSLAIFFSLMVSILFLVLIGWLIVNQFVDLSNQYSVIQQNLNNHWQNLSDFINAKTQFSTKDQLTWIQKESNLLLGNAGNFISGAALSISNLVVFISLVPIYTFLILFYRSTLVQFVLMWFSNEQHAHVIHIIKEIEYILKSYIGGLLIQIIYIIILLGTALYLLGIKHALLIGLVFALLNLIPYLGALIGNIIGVLLTMSASQDFIPILKVLGAISAVQFLDNNILMPRIVGGKVQLNALASILGVLCGGAFAGIPGMFLSLPLLAVLKIIFDHSNGLKQWGVLLGNGKK